MMSCTSHCPELTSSFPHRLMETAKEMIHDSLPIKCLEAVIVALYLTAPLTTVQRFTLGFKSKCGDMYYR